MNIPEKVRNVCIISHVDHGKSTLADQLLWTSGLISRKLAGQIRFMDSRSDEQERGITMKSSSVSLLGPNGLLVNLIDSPGHVDFSGEVSSAVRLSDGAMVLVDVVEGMCAQTETVMRQAWKERLGMVLVLNKIDRLILDLNMTPLEAYHHLRKLIEQVNAFASTFHVSEAFFKGEEIDDDSQIQFDPLVGNVVFASAFDGWAFRISDLARFVAKRLNMNEKALGQILWGDFYFQKKTKKVLKKPYASKKEVVPMFVQFGLNNIWKVYKDVVVEEHLQKMKGIIDSLELKIPPRELMTSDWKAKLSAIMSRWFPLSTCIFSTLEEQILSPVQSQTRRMDAFTETFSQDIAKCDPEGPLVVYIGKMVSDDGLGHVNEIKYERKAYVRGKVANSNVVGISKSEEKENSIDMQNDDDDETTSSPSTKSTFVGLGRVLSGTIKQGEPVYLITGSEDNSATMLTDISLGLWMGRSIDPIDSVPCGNICAIYGIDSTFYTATISSNPEQTVLLPLSMHSSPIIKVAVSPNPLSIENLRVLQTGLGLLRRADPNVLVFVEETGEHVLVTCGELHLERCLTDLRERFAKGLEINVSEPIVSFRETVLPFTNKTLDSDDSVGNLYFTPSGDIGVRVRALGIPNDLQKQLSESPDMDFEVLLKELHRLGLSNISRIWSVLAKSDAFNLLSTTIPISATHSDVVISSIINGFKLACKYGPLCEEPISGVIFIIDEIIYKENASEGDAGALSGQILGSVKDACRDALSRGDARLVEAVFKVEFICNIESLGKLFALLEQRRGRIYREYAVQGTSLFQIDAYFPVAESFGFTSVLRQRTQGTANPQMSFSHWEVLNLDPADNNLCTQIVNDIRRRKGLYVHEHVVEHAEKQRTLKK